MNSPKSSKTPIPLELAQGLCVAIDPDEADRIFHPTSATDPARYNEARRMCARCPVSECCLEYALGIEFGSASARAGMYGGKTPRERANIHRNRRDAERKAS